jgi:hypothetical protein
MPCLPRGVPYEYAKQQKNRIMVKGKNIKTKTMSKILKKRKADMPDARNSGSRAAVFQQTQWVTSCARPFTPISPHHV